MRLMPALMLLLIGIATTARAAPMDDVLRAELLGLFDRYNKAILANKWNDAAAMRDPKTRADILAELKKPKAKQSGLLAMARDMAPDTVEPQYASLTKDGQKATIVTLASKKVPANARMQGGPPPGGIIKFELTLEFAQEANAWKFAQQTFGLDPTKLKPCTDEPEEKAEAYDSGRDMSFGGQIRRVEFRPNHTLLVIRMIDEEACAILPSKAALQADGFRTESLAPYRIVEMEGHPHKTDSQRALVTDLRMVPED